MEMVLFMLTSPPVILFIVGVIAALGNSNIKIPESLSIALNIYLLLAIGIKGGIGLSTVTWADLSGPLTAALTLGILLPLVGYLIGRLLKFQLEERIAMAATFGSVSLVTFAAAAAQLETIGIIYEPYMTTLVVIMEIPGLVVALLLYQSLKQQVVLGIVPQSSVSSVMLESVMSKSILLLLAGLVAGFAAPNPATLEPFFIDLFPGVLLIFLLGLGLKVGSHLHSIKEYGLKLVIAGVLFPIIGGFFGYVAAGLTGLSDGGTILLMALAASGSYIAAPAMLQASVPDVKPSFYLTMALAVTFPFNLLIGIPVFIKIVAG
ncbi:sodium-dependent bicarbonate transport family permease [Paenalkalicoccus suaedae]|uniref:Sodium-dependent bicarbonate transport family permease n=1 Tax=Paenalkalicoccus suaedae TaxID=2592382 RepID=A0A859FBH0_9BACI|nr:sodium-dependent bicarbonate transport family permease [Paenalkalicoccus suaedae]QKS70703.1 sodium-dependent bicarbonate transport family permease [Paenalkalicoccus suaedae]